MISLPIDKSLGQVVAAAREHRALVLVAPPGAGKTTRVPPALLTAGLLDREHPNLLMLQPRRVAARASAERIADEQGWELGREVGYQVRFERRMGPDTRLRVVTEGILTRQLLADPFLEGVGAVLLDEFHERSLHTDLAVALLREVRQTVRPDLILVVMSATLDAEGIAAFLGDCPIVRSEGRTYPIEIEHRPAHLLANRHVLPSAVADAVALELARPADPGDVLVFLPGADEIRRTGRALESLAASHNLLVLPLHGSLPFEEQSAALRPASRRKIILATNIAETSLTIDGVRTVIDSGLGRVAGYDPQRGFDRLEVQRISRASATQRAGRAGRTAPGRCIRLWSVAEERAMSEFERPEIRRVDLCGTLLTLHAWGTRDPRTFGWFEPPEEQSVTSAERLLAWLGALDAETGGKITALGRELHAVPLHPRLARLMVGAASLGHLQDGATLAALLEETDILRPEPFSQNERSPVAGASDLVYRMDLFAAAERRHFNDGSSIDPAAARRVARSRDELIRRARKVAVAKTGAGIDRDETLRRLVLLAYPDRVARRRTSDPATAAIVGGGGIRLAPESVVRPQHEFFVAVDARQDERNVAREAFVRIASAIDPRWLEELFPEQVRRVSETIYDPQRERVVGRTALYYRDLLLREDRDAAVDPQKAGEVLAEALRPAARAMLEKDEEARTWLARLQLLQQAMPELPWPVLDDAALGELLTTICQGKRTAEEVRRVPLVPHLQAMLHYPLDRRFEQETPKEIAVPSGSRIRLDYTAGQRPVLAVRLQELFGWTDTPRIAGGRVPVVLHLLGPNFRQVQITDDLRSFWSTTYFQVRKDLRIRYPKHSWPEDPLTARPEAKGRRR